MLQLQPQGPDLWDSILPEEQRKPPEESETQGRLTVPVSIHLQLMYLKFRYRLGYETLVEEICDSIRWRRFCSIGYQEQVPETSTLIKRTYKYGEQTLVDPHALRIEALRNKKRNRGRQVRMDTTVIAMVIAANLYQLGRGP